MDKSLIFLALLLPASLGYIQEMIIYSEPNCQGNFHGFQTRESNLSNYQFFLQSTQSFRASGWWLTFNGTNFEDYYISAGISGTCSNRTYSSINSLKYLGPSETSTEAITATEGHTENNRTNYILGRDVLVTAPAATNFGFIARGGIIAGYSNWTLYYNADFTGNSSCYQGTNVLSSFSSIMYSSVIRGCGAAAEEVRQLILKNNRL